MVAPVQDLDNDDHQPDRYRGPQDRVADAEQDSLHVGIHVVVLSSPPGYRLRISESVTGRPCSSRMWVVQMPSAMSSFSPRSSKYTLSAGFSEMSRQTSW